MRTLLTETWKDIPGYEGSYQASSLGQIRSVDRAITQIGRWGTPFTRRLKGKILKPGRYCRSGHVSVVLGRGTVGKPVHQLVTLAFLGEPGLYEEVRHKNGDPTDNRIENLHYGTRTENILDVYHQGGRWRKLSIKDVIEIRKLLKSGKQGSAIARMFNVSESTISSIKRGASYSWLKP